jgi:hypothetical protein
MSIYDLFTYWLMSQDNLQSPHAIVKTGCSTTGSIMIVKQREIREREQLTWILQLFLSSSAAVGWTRSWLQLISWCDRSGGWLRRPGWWTKPATAMSHSWQLQLLPLACKSVPPCYTQVSKTPHSLPCTRCTRLSSLLLLLTSTHSLTPSTADSSPTQAHQLFAIYCIAASLPIQPRQATSKYCSYCTTQVHLLISPELSFL